MKNKKILKIVLITVLLMLITFAIWFIRKFIIMNKIAKASEKWNNATNYSLEFNQREEESDLMNLLNNGVYYSDLLVENLYANTNYQTQIDETTGNEIKLTARALKIEDIDGKECYTVMSKYTDTKQCHDKESGLPIKIICNANSEDEANKSYIIYKDWKFNEVDDKEVIRPDTTKYNVD